MKKMITFSVATLMVAGIAGAQQDNVMVGQVPENDPAQTEVTAEVALVSSYVWRGQVYNDGFVAQPQLTVAKNGFSINVWGNYDLEDNLEDNSSKFSELDVSLAYTLPLNINDFAIDIGLINYNFPNSDVAETTTELFAGATLLTFQDLFVPSVTLYGDIDEASGIYLLFDVVAPIDISEYFGLEAGVSAGWGDSSYNDFYFADQNGNNKRDKGFNDYNFYANANYEIMENLTASLNLTYTLLEGGQIRNSADDIYESDEKFWGGVNLAYDF